MRFVYGKQDMSTLEQAQANCWLMTNGLGGYVSMSAAFSAARGDHGLLIGAEVAPSTRVHLVHGLSERIVCGSCTVPISTQVFSGGQMPEEGFRNLSTFVWDGSPEWLYEAEGFSLWRSCVTGHGENTAAVSYRITNHTAQPGTLIVSPRFSCHPKGQVRKEPCSAAWDGQAIRCGSSSVFVQTDGCLIRHPVRWETLYFPVDAQDGRNAEDLVFSCLRIECTVQPGQTAELHAVFADAPITKDAQMLHQAHRDYLAALPVPFQAPVARELARAADAYLSRRDSTDGQTIIAGFPFFGDWGRDTMIALPGCALATHRMDIAKNILQTFLTYERDGLVPNLFPEDGQPPQYNTVDAALLLIHCAWLYYQRTGDNAFIQAAYPIFQRIIDAYIWGTAHGIKMEPDGLIRAGAGLDQVTWMDVCIDGVLPTPRHGKPVEINAYWYNALRIMEQLAPIAGVKGECYGRIAQHTKKSFLEKFWMADKGYLRDVLSGTPEETQLRCNQIWAVTMPFSMLSRQQEAAIVEAVYRVLYTPCGLRTLSPDDAQFHPTYGGVQKQRDLAYHQGTVWVYPLGAYYRAYLKVHGDSKEAAAEVRRQLDALEPMLREGCIGQLPEIYDGLHPGASRGCFAQAWSVGELLTVYECLERIEVERNQNAG